MCSQPRGKVFPFPTIATFLETRRRRLAWWVLFVVIFVTTLFFAAATLEKSSVRAVADHALHRRLLGCGRTLTGRRSPRSERSASPSDLRDGGFGRIDSQRFGEVMTAPRRPLLPAGRGAPSDTSSTHTALAESDGQDPAVCEQDHSRRHGSDRQRHLPDRLPVRDDRQRQCRRGSARFTPGRLRLVGIMVGGLIVGTSVAMLQRTLVALPRSPADCSSRHRDLPRFRADLDCIRQYDRSNRPGAVWMIGLTSPSSGSRADIVVASCGSPRCHLPQLNGGSMSATHIDRICTSCVLDTTVPDIAFDEDGVCNYCHRYHERIAIELRYDEAGQQRLAELIDEIKPAGKGKPYDSIVGISGGADSTYVAYIAKRKYGLRPLAIHVDNGWNSELAVQNIEQTLRRLEIDLHTNVLDWEEFRDLQRSFLESGIANAEIPTDHSILATLFQTARSMKIRHVLTGSNLVTEAVLPESWMYDAYDLRLIKAVQKRFGQVPLKTFPKLSYARLGWMLGVQGYKFVNVLDFKPYNKQDVKRC